MQKTNEPFGTPDADGWYEWKGDDMVRPAGVVTVAFRDGSRPKTAIASDLNWLHDYLNDDIVRWRPAQ